ncbi:MAG: HD domain-containing protein [Tenuifilaceae bacterium]|jgi:hypothetical protein|nr:HD domain-containing protein [Tenuifilaceae bacterium]
MHLLQEWFDAIGFLIDLALRLSLFLFAVAAAVLIFGRKREAVTEISLRNLSKLWTKEGKQEIHISKLSPIWREEKTIAEPDIQLPDLQNSRATAFMNSVLQGPFFEKAPLQKAACGKILKLLDQEGNCPSVVNLKGDVEGSWDENTYQILARTTLLDHSLNVADQAIQLLSASESFHVIPDTVVAALGHDLGKLESSRGYLYSVGEHPLTAGRPLVEIEEFLKLPRKNEIERAIKLHHKRPDGLLGKTLKKADQLARQKELEENISRLENKSGLVESKPPLPTQELKNDSIAMESIESSTKDKAAAAWQAQSDIYGDRGEKIKATNVSDVPKLMDISHWFDAEQFLEGLKPYINKMFGRRFMAFSMPDGYVYFQAKVLEEVARKQAERAGCMEIATMAQKDPTLQRVLFTIVHQLRRENDIIARGLIKDNYFGGYFTVTRKIGDSMKGFYTPFHAEVFGSIAEMEQNKSDILLNIQSVKPYMNYETEE